MRRGVRDILSSGDESEGKVQARIVPVVEIWDERVPIVLRQAL